MKRRLLDWLACPRCSADLTLDDGASIREGEIDEGGLTCSGCGTRYPVARSIPRFTGGAYAESFGRQWNAFKRTQIDAHNGTTISRDRFATLTGWRPGELAGERVLDGGCGAGRFSQIALDFGAEVVAVDLSHAVDAAWDNLRGQPAADRLHVVQADLYHLPFRPGVFDRVFSLGVLQHTPDVERATKALPPMLRPGGRLALWVYERRLSNYVLPKYHLRRFTTRLDTEKLFHLLERAVPTLLRMSNAVGRLPVAGRHLRRLVPVANYEGVLPLDARQLEEWALLDTFDWLSPTYDQPQSFATLRRWLTEAGCREIQVGEGASVRAVKDQGIVS